MTKHLPKMSHEELDQALKTIGWSDRDLASRVEYSHQYIAQMRRGARPVLDRVADYVLAILAAMAQVQPPPKDDAPPEPAASSND